MYKFLLKKESREYWGNKVNRIYIMLFVVVCSIFIPVFSQKNFYIILPILCTGYIMQLCPQVFAEERENNTFETLISLPLSMKKIFYTKVLWLFLIEFLLFIGLLTLGSLTVFIKSGFSLSLFSQTNIYYMVIGILLVPTAIWNLAYHSSLISIKVGDTRSCALSTIWLSIIYGILIVTLYAVIQAGLDTLTNLFVAVAYLFLNLLVYAVLNKSGKKYFSKTYCGILCKKG